MKKLNLKSRTDSNGAQDMTHVTQLAVIVVALIALVLLVMLLPETAPIVMPGAAGQGSL